MESLTVSFAGSSVAIGYHSAEAEAFLSLLFPDITGKPDGQNRPQQLSLLENNGRDGYRLSSGERLLHHGPLGVRFAAYLYDTVIFHLLNRASTGIALHAGAVACGDKTILLPGQSGAGKSTLTAWLVSRGCSYLTDELIFIASDDANGIAYFNRPVCLKPTSVPLIAPLLTHRQQTGILLDRHGAVIPHRFLRQSSSPAEPSTSLIILPSYQPNLESELESVSKARLGPILMGCHVNARNLADHGFRKLLSLAGTTPAYRLRYASLQDAETQIGGLLQGRQG